MQKRYDIIVVGGGHAGCEAALAAARLGLETLLITGSIDRIAAMSCNPAIGGVGKGHLVKEMDALGGQMPIIADETGIHFRILNASRGPAVQATRCQSDMNRYQVAMSHVILNTPGLRVRQDDVIGLLAEDQKVLGIDTKLGGPIYAKKVILTTGTFLSGLLHVGALKTPGGRAGEAPTSGLSASLQGHGLKLSRLKTGTCPRLDGRTIRYDLLEEQKPEIPAPLFSIASKGYKLPQVSCFMTYTNTHTHEAILQAVSEGHAPIYNGQIGGAGPRYCPSIEDKVVRFAQKESHLIFLEPHGLDTYEVYPNGLSTSLPPKTQLSFLRTLKGLEEVEITRFGYAVEYDFVEPTQLFSTLETKVIAGLYCAGQINGTTGYEEAASQGLLAGINAALSVLGKNPLVLHRYEAYLGVLVDDLVTLGTQEPYRMFTSRAEHRLVLREDNVYDRLAEKGAQIGLLDAKRKAAVETLNEEVQKAHRAILNTKVDKIPLLSWAKRPEIDEHFIQKHIEEPLSIYAIKKAMTEIRYEGYIERTKRALEEEKTLEEKAIPAYFFEAQLPGMSNEVYEKLKRIRPTTLGQASRISGITPAALSLIAVALKREQAYAGL